jgi:hypothetical protein
MPKETESESQPAPTFEEQYATELREKLGAGLTKDQAIQVVRSQVAHDKALEEEEKARAGKRK